MRRKKSLKLELIKAIIHARLESYPELTAARRFELLKVAGYPGGISHLRDHVAQVGPKPSPEPLVGFET